MKDRVLLRNTESYRRAIISASSGWLVPTQKSDLSLHSNKQEVHTGENFDSTTVEHCEKKR